MKPLLFLQELRDASCLPIVRVGKEFQPPTNNVLRQWLKDNVVEVNGTIIHGGDELEFPIESMRLFPNNKQKTVTLR